MEVQPHLVSLGLNRNPFPPTPDASSYFFTGNLERDLAEVKHCILARKGIILITGEVGLGKSTFVCHLLNELVHKAVIYAVIHNTFLQDEALLHAINLDFGIAADGDMARDIATLNKFLLEQSMLDRTCLLVIDDAQNLTPKSLELLRLLTNLETGQEKLIQILITGQPELCDTLSRSDLRQFTSRIVKHVRLDGMNEDEVGKYFAFRVDQAGAGGRIRLNAGAAGDLHRASCGNPRRIHLILDRCLYGLLSKRSTEIDSALVRAAEKDVDMFSKTRSYRRKSRRISRADFALAGLMLAAGLGLAVSYFGSEHLSGSKAATIQSPPVAPATVVARANPEDAHPTAVTHQEAVAMHPEITLATCLKSLTAKAGSEIRLIPLTKSQGKFVKTDADTCLYHEGDNLWVVWRSGWKPTDLLTPQANLSVRTLQKNLSRQGLMDVNSIDGFFGSRTREALSSFQTRIGSGKRGEPDDLTLFLLERVSPDQGVIQNNADTKKEARHG